MEPAEKLFDEALEDWLAPSREDPSAAPSPGAAATVPVGAALGSQDALSSGVRTKAASGHSPSVRALVNAGDTLVSFAQVSAAPPPGTLRSRLLTSISGRGLAEPGERSAAGAPAGERRPARSVPARVAVEVGAVRGGSSAMSFAWSPPNEAVVRLHVADPGEALRQARIDALEAGATGGRGLADRALAMLLEQIAPFFDFEVVLVSTVRGQETIHRVHRGFPVELGNMDVVPRALSFCTHTVSAREPFVVQNAASEAFFRSSALVSKLGARAYLGVPLFAPASDADAAVVALGALCAISVRPQRITEVDVELLSRFSRVVQAIVVRDVGALAALVSAARVPPGEPSSGPTASEGGWAVAAGLLRGPVLYQAPFFHELVEAQSARAREARALHRAMVARVPKQALEGWTAEGGGGSFPESLVAAELGGDVALLVPARHPDCQSVLEMLALRGAEIEEL
jgi:hypothetical protein